MLYITKEYVDNLYKGFCDEQDSLWEYKSERSKKKIIPEYEQSRYITLSYARWLCKRIGKMLSKGAHLTPEVLIDSLQHTDWTHASYDGKGEFSNQYLCKTLMVKKVPKDNEYKKRFELLDMQASYMAKASRLICDLLDNNCEYEKIEYTTYGNIKEEK